MNPIVELSVFCQKTFKKSIITNVIKIEGPDHCPVITVQILLPDGRIFYGEGSNKKNAKQQAATLALIELAKI